MTTSQWPDQPARVSSLDSPKTLTSSPPFLTSAHLKALRAWKRHNDVRGSVPYTSWNATGAAASPSHRSSRGQTAARRVVEEQMTHHTIVQVMQHQVSSSQKTHETRSSIISAASHKLTYLVHDCAGVRTRPGSRPCPWNPTVQNRQVASCLHLSKRRLQQPETCSLSCCASEQKRTEHR